MASCAAGKTFRVYGQYTSLVCKLMIKTWGHIFEANEKKNTKNTCEPSKKSYSLFSGLCYNIFNALPCDSYLPHFLQQALGIYISYLISIYTYIYHLHYHIRIYMCICIYIISITGRYEYMKYEYRA